MIIGRVLSSSIEKNRDTDTNVLMLKVEISEPEDIQQVEMARQPGIDARPTEDTTVFIEDVSEAWKVATGADDNIEPSVAAGEVAIYAANAGAKKSQVRCKVDGTIEAGLQNLALVAIAEKVMSTLNNAITKAIAGVKPQDGGAGAFTAFQSALADADISSTNLKAEK